ncbi:MAG: cell shape-determining protein MreC [Porticoccaceae bacterium]|nr:MAG: cell shape-determining protein MreC [Porticoccaceae bacterium]
MVLGTAALLLAVVDGATDWFAPLKAPVRRLAEPVHQLATWPTRLSDLAARLAADGSDLRAENARLERELLVYRGQLQRMAAISAENARLRALLGAAELVRDEVRVAELVGVSPDPTRHLVVLDRGARDGVYVGQPVLDGQGLMGQVIEVNESRAHALLITDPSHAVPVQVLRNGLRAIAEGTGDYRRLVLRHISPTADLAVGDRLVTSGLGGRFPPGYPVGIVTEIRRDPGEPFLRVTVEPAADVEHSRHLLLVFAERRGALGEDQGGEAFGEEGTP